MAKKIASFTKMIFIVFCSLLVALSIFGTRKIERVFADMTVTENRYTYEQDDVTVDENYTLHQGFYPCSGSDIGFSGQNYVTNSTLTVGHYFTTQVDGAKIALGNSFGEVLGYGKNNVNANKFSLTGMVVPNTSASDPSNKDYNSTQKFIGWSFQTLKFIITDNADSNNRIEVTMKGATNSTTGYYGSSDIVVSASYNGMALSTAGDEQNVSLHRATFRNRYYNEWLGYPFNFEFSKTDSKINVYNLKTMQSGEKYLEGYPCGSLEIDDLQGFESYTVEMQFCDLNNIASYNTARKANVILFEMAGQVLAPTRETWSDTSGPIVGQKVKEVVALKEYDLASVLSMYDMTQGNINTIGTTEGKYTVKVDSVNCTSGKYIFNQAKDYTIEYTIYDNFNNGVAQTSRTKTITVNCVQDTTAPVLRWINEYKDEYILKSQLELLEIDAVDYYDDNLTITKKAYNKSGESWNELTVSQNGFVYLETAGEYKIQYIVQDFSGNSATLEAFFVVEPIIVDLPESITEDYTQGIIYLPQLSLASEISYYVERFDLSDTALANGERIKTLGLLLSEPCSFYLRYTIFSGDETAVIFTKDVLFEIKDTEKPAIDAVSYSKNYDLGAEIEIKNPKVSDNHLVDGALSYKVLLGTKDITDKVRNGKLTLANAGTYTIVYAAKDFSGNLEEVSYTFNVQGVVESDVALFSGKALVIFIIIVVLLAVSIVGNVFFVSVFVKRRK